MNLTSRNERQLCSSVEIRFSLLTMTQCKWTENTLSVPESFRKRNSLRTEHQKHSKYCKALRFGPTGLGLQNNNLICFWGSLLTLIIPMSKWSRHSTVSILLNDFPDYSFFYLAIYYLVNLYCREAVNDVMRRLNTGNWDLLHFPRK